MLPNKNFPIILNSVKGVCQQDNQFSSFNFEEVEAVIVYVNRILNEEYNGKIFLPCHIGN